MSEQHTKDAWFSLGRVVSTDAKGEFLKLPNANGRGYHYDHVFSMEETIDASEQVIDCPTARKNRHAAKEYRDLCARTRATFPDGQPPVICGAPYKEDTDDGEQE